jgi:chromosome segregation ATPase
LSKTSQFLITTFKPELIGVADRLFEIDYKNNVSTMNEITKEQGYGIIDTFDDDENNKMQ